MSNWKRTSTYCFILAVISLLAFIYANFELYAWHKAYAEDHAAAGFIGMVMFPLMGLAMRSTDD